MCKKYFLYLQHKIFKTMKDLIMCLAGVAAIYASVYGAKYIFDKIEGKLK